MNRYETRIPFFLMWKYLKRGNKWTLFFIIFLMAIAFINLVFITSLFNGIIRSAQDQIIDTYTGHLMITSPTGSDYIENSALVKQELEALPTVKGISLQTQIPGTLQYDGYKGTWPILAIDPAGERSVTNVAENMLEGSYLEKDDTDSIIIGRQIAGGENVEMNAFSFKGAHAGDRVTLRVGEMEKIFTIKGIFYTKFIDTDQRAFITEQAWRAFDQSAGDAVTSIIVRLEKKGEEQTVIDTLKSKGVAGNYFTWEDVSGLMETVTNSFASINFLMSLVGMLIAAITIFIVIYIDITNKKREIGILRAIGIKPYLIRAAYVIQTLIYSLSGVLLGTVIFFGVLVPYFNAYPFALPIGDAKLVVNPADYIFRLEAVILIAIVSGLIPAFMVTRMKILDAIWGRN